MPLKLGFRFSMDECNEMMQNNMNNMISNCHKSVRFVIHLWYCITKFWCLYFLVKTDFVLNIICTNFISFIRCKQPILNLWILIIFHIFSFQIVPVKKGKENIANAIISLVIGTTESFVQILWFRENMYWMYYWYYINCWKPVDTEENTSLYLYLRKRNPLTLLSSNRGNLNTFFKTFKFNTFFKKHFKFNWIFLKMKAHYPNFKKHFIKPSNLTQIFENEST